MLNYVNGIQAGMVKVWKDGVFINGNLTGASLHTTVIFDVCTVEGQPEVVTSDQEDAELLSGEKEEDVIGYRHYFTFNYGDRCTKEMMFKIKDLYTYKKLGYVLELYPNKEILPRRFYALLKGDFAQKVQKNDYDTEGHERVKLEFESKFLDDSLRMYDPDDIYSASVLQVSI